MNHYPRHIGDWIKATAHLSEVEECIYSRCLDVYYDREGPLPADQKQVCRLVRASSKAARDAVDTVLHEFFVLESDGWHQKRCDEEIAAYREKSEKARASINKRWQKNAATNNERDTNVYTNVNESYGERNTNQNQNQNQNHGTNPPHTVTDTSSAGGAGELTKPMVQAGIRCNPGHPDILALAASGCTPETVQAAIDEARLTKQNPPQGYVVAILKRWQSDPASAHGNAPRAPPRNGYESEKDRSRRETYEGLTGRKTANEPDHRTIEAVAHRVD